MKKADVHKMYREDASAAIESMAIAGSGIEELIATALFSGLAVDIFMVTGEIEITAAFPVITAKDPNWQWAVEHRYVLVNLITRLLGIVNFDVVGFKPFGWLAIFTDFPQRWQNQLRLIAVPKTGSTEKRRLVELPMADRLMMAAYLPSLLYAMIRVIANVPRLVGDLMPG